MDEDGPTASMIFAILLLINLFIYGFSVAIEYLNEKEVERRAEEEEDKSAVRLMQILNSPKECKNVIQLVSLLIHVFTGYFCIGDWIGSAQEVFDRVFQQFAWNISEEITGILSGIVVFGAFLYVTMIIGVLVPKKLAKMSPEKWAYAGIATVGLLNSILRPFIRLITKSAYLILILLGVNTDAEETDVT